MKYGLLCCLLFVRQFYSSMQAISSNFQKYISEIQSLRKQISGQKLAHENTLKQLHSAYQIIDDMKDALRIEQNNNTKIKAQLNQTTLNLNTVAHQYQSQISQIKELLSVKDEELRRINSYLRVNDADIIRMKVVNELQLDHAEKIEAVHSQIAKKSAENTQLRTNHQLVLQKYELLQREMRSQLQQSQDKIEEITQKYMEQLKVTYEQLQRQRNQHSKWAKKYQMLQQRFNKQAEIYRAEMQKMTRQLQDQNKSLLSNNQAKINKHRVQKLQDSLSKLKEEVASEKEINSKLEDELTKIRKECKNYKKGEHDLMLEKERCLQEIQHLKRQIAHKDTQHKKNIEAVQRQMQNKSDNTLLSNKDDREKMQKLQAQIRKLNLRVQQLQNDNQLLKQQALDKNTALLKKQLSQKQEEIECLKDELRTLKKKQGQRKRAVSMQEKTEESINQYKIKLQEANGKIVQLLRQKIELKQEISSLKGK